MDPEHARMLDRAAVGRQNRGQLRQRDGVDIALTHYPDDGSIMQDYEILGQFYLGRSYDVATRKASDDLILYDSRDLVTHAVCVGMTGSGKTGLCISLLEEAAIDRVPAIAIDPKGDIANLLLTFPQLRGDDFLPWVEEGEAQRAGLDPPGWVALVARPGAPSRRAEDTGEQAGADRRSGQSPASTTSPPLRVPIARHTAIFTPSPTKRTEPSTSEAGTPPLCWLLAEKTPASKWKPQSVTRTLGGAAV